MRGLSRVLVFVVGCIHILGGDGAVYDESLLELVKAQLDCDLGQTVGDLVTLANLYQSTKTRHPCTPPLIPHLYLLSRASAGARNVFFWRPSTPHTHEIFVFLRSHAGSRARLLCTQAEPSPTPQTSWGTTFQMCRSGTSCFPRYVLQCPLNRLLSGLGTIIRCGRDHPPPAEPQQPSTAPLNVSRV